MTSDKNFKAIRDRTIRAEESCSQSETRIAEHLSRFANLMEPRLIQIESTERLPRKETGRRPGLAARYQHWGQWIGAAPGLLALVMTVLIWRIGVRLDQPHPIGSGGF